VGLIGFCYAKKKFYARSVHIKPAPDDHCLFAFSIYVTKKMFKIEKKLKKWQKIN